jgi:8-oxo-dGTP diphosphatase
VQAENAIHIRVCLAVVEKDKILLVPHYQTDACEVQWGVPGGRVIIGESLRAAARREFYEETGLEAEVTGLLNVSEVILPDQPYHSITIAFWGRIIRGRLRSEKDHPYGVKTPQWFSAAALRACNYHPKETVEKALGSGSER